MKEITKRKLENAWESFLSFFPYIGAIIAGLFGMAAIVCKMFGI